MLGVSSYPLSHFWIISGSVLQSCTRLHKWYKVMARIGLYCCSLVFHVPRLKAAYCASRYHSLAEDAPRPTIILDPQGLLDSVRITS